MTERPAIWREGGIALHDYGGAGRPVLVVPSLVNRPDVLDLMAGHGMLADLLARGLRPLLLDWGQPDGVARRFTLTDYIAGPLERAALVACRIAGGPIPVLGYCMGGTLSVALAHRRPECVAGLVLLAAPWDFATADAAGLRAFAPGLLAWAAREGALPADAINAVFAWRDHAAIARKFVAFGGAAQDGPEAARFVAIEDWLGEGVALAEPVARACIETWYGENAPGRGVWHVAGQAIDPATLTCPVLCVAPTRDRIVPPASALAILRDVPGGTELRPQAGHIGMVAGAGAPAIWRDVHGWLAALPAPRAAA